MKRGTPSEQGFNLEQTFFGFNPADRITFHENLFNLIWYGEGRWTWDDVYYMPIFLRKFWINKINKIFEERQAAYDAQAAKVKSSSTRKKTSR